MNGNWEYLELHDAVTKDSSNISLNKIKEEDGNYPVFGAKGFVQNASFYQQGEDYLAIIKDGAGIGRVSKHPAKSSVVATMQYLIPKDGFDIDFIRYFLEGIDFEKHRSGSTIPHIYFKDYKSEKFPKIPLSEQQRIVFILDRVFSVIERSRNNAGKNLQNAKEVFENYLQGVFERKGEGWEEKTLGDVCSLITDGKHGDCENEENSGYYFLSAKDVRNGSLLFDNARQINKSGFEETHRRTDLKPGDICMVNTGATIGRISFAPNDPRTYRTTFQKSVAVIKTIPTLIDNDFCCYILKSDLKKLVKLSSGAAVPNLLLGDLKRHNINIPKSKTEQKTIVRQLDALQAKTKKLETLYQKKIDALDELKKSILQKAMHGELISASSITAENELTI